MHRTWRPGRRLLLYILVPVLAGGLVGASAYSILALKRARERQRMEERRASERSTVLLARAGELMDRHPDFDLQGQREYLGSYVGESPAKLRQQLPRLEAFVGELELELLARSTGLQPQDPLWPEAAALKSFSPSGFGRLYEALRLPGTAALPGPPPITGDDAADARIVELALARGYRLRPQADEQSLSAVGRQRLQPEALAAWLSMQQEALKEGVRLALVSGYRSVERQREIFLAELKRTSLAAAGRPYSAAEIAAGKADAAVEAVLRSSSIPGFSRHHSGYTLDLGDLTRGGSLEEFGESPGFRWLSAHNYLNAKRFGFIPSYPAGAAPQGPDPEPWEYLWVGEGPLRAP
jgi:LAS superfamily LD-carboxypeptidase LdcB